MKELFKIDKQNYNKDGTVGKRPSVRGVIVKAESIQEFGYVRRIEKGKVEDIFIQDNYYYLCEVDEVQVEQNLDDSEEKEQIITFRGMLERENRVLEQISGSVFG